jgi:hypothetical protein
MFGLYLSAPAVRTFSPTKENPRQAGFRTFWCAIRLLDLGFLIDHVLANRWIVLLRLHFLGVQLLVLGGRVEVTGSSARDETDFFAITL